MAPDVTILVPTFERPVYLERCLRHHLRTFDEAGLDYEILVCDNGADEATREVVERFAAQSPRIRTVRHPRNLGGFGNSLYGHRHARGTITVTVGDDDLLIPEIVASHLERFRADPGLAMIQAPWFLMSESRRNEITGMAYELAEEIEIAHGDFAAAARLILSRRIFPEVFAVRTSLASEILDVADPAAYYFFRAFARAVAMGRVLFVPTPHAIVAYATRHGHHQGGVVTADGWDTFRGGLELLLGAAREREPGVDWSAEVRALEEIVLDRLAFAMRIRIDQRKWHTAWLIYRRLRAHGMDPLAPSARAELESLAGMEAALIESVALGCVDIVVEDRVYAMYLNVLDVERIGAPLCCLSDWGGERRGRTAFVGLGWGRERAEHEDDLVVDLAAAMRRTSFAP